MPPHAAYALNRFPFSGEDLFRTEVLAGLSARPRTLSPRRFYDRRGSELFEAITALPEYYPTRAECSILLAGVKYFFRRRQLFLPVLSLHHWSTFAQSDAKSVRSSGSEISARLRL